KDITHCLSEPYAPFPAILLCFATIDLLGALSNGDASRKAKTSEQSADYMKKYMNYTDEQAQLFIKIFRHKIVHLAQPKAVTEYNGKKVTWRYWHNNAEHHLNLSKLKEAVEVSITSAYSIKADYEFEISIMHIVKDISNSVKKPEGYLHSLETNVDLQDRFEKAISEIYSFN
ncbi:MAG: hypothetical protein ABII27_00640, partial [bacterium]